MGDKTILSEPLSVEQVERIVNTLDPIGISYVFYEEFAAKEVKRKREAENIARKAQERERKIISLETEQKMLKTELSKINKGMY